MHATTVLQRLLGPVLSTIDKRNAVNLMDAVCACLAGRRLGLMALARHWPGALFVAAPLKRLDRLLSNRQMQSARARVYQAALAWVIRQRQPVFIVDWSELTRDGRWQLLRAGVATKGRSVTVYEEVHPQRSLNARRVHTAFLNRLKTILPANCQPLIVTDAGFHAPWFRAVASMGWPWLGRVRGRIKVRRIDPSQPFAPWLPVRDYFARATAQPEDLGDHQLTASQGLACRLVRVKRAPQNRQQKRRRDGHRARGGKANKMARSQREPWVLACSPDLASRSARDLARLYGLRMQIEASFRDLKSHHYGCAFEDSQTRVGPRLEMLLLIHMLATLLAWLGGIACADRHEHRFKLSLLRRGWEYLRCTEHRLRHRRKPPWSELQRQIASYATNT